ncbi:MAG: hypothetical protein RLY61_399 [Candidatus Parcubacteria bacterium]|jgi:hypothetical protein
MSVFKTTFTRSLRAHPSDNANIAYPSVAESGVNTTATTNLLIDSAATFITNNVATGDIVHNDTDGTAATVVSVDSETQLTLNANIFTATGKAFVVYAQSPQSGMGNPGCFLYVGGTGNVSVVTIGGDTITFNGVPAGTTLPIQVLKLRSSGTTATLVNALW